MWSSMSPFVPDLRTEIWKDLSRDQQILYPYTKAIASGKVPDDLGSKVACQGLLSDQVLHQVTGQVHLFS